MQQNPHIKPSLRLVIFDWLKDGGARTIGYLLSFLVVAGVAGRVSYSHIRDIALLAHQPLDVANVIPLSVDGLLIVASLAMAQDKAKGLMPRPWARFGFWFGAGISITCNIGDTVATSDLILKAEVAMTVAAIFMLGFSVFMSALAPAILLVATEIVARPGKPPKNQARSQGAKEGWAKRRENKTTGRSRTGRRSTGTGTTRKAQGTKTAPKKADTGSPLVVPSPKLVMPTDKELATLTN